MDVLLKGSTFNFFVDEIFLLNSEKSDESVITNQKNIFGAVLIPNIKSTYFPPMHLRKFLFTPEFLTFDYYKSYTEKIQDLPLPDNYQFRGSIAEGNYYEIPSNLFPGRIFPSFLTTDFHNILEEFKFNSPFENELDMDNIVNFDKGVNILNVDPKSEENRELLVYCFNVGQGDSILIIFPNKNVYIVDTNIYSGNSLKKYIDVVRNILTKNELPENKIKSLIITHKHLDHLRGAEKLIVSEEFEFKHFLINYDYNHKTNVVHHLLDAAKQKIPNNINVNKPGSFKEGKVEVTILNPKHDTFNNTVCKDLNDTSIVILLQYGESNVLLSGDAGYPVINSVLTNSFTGKNMLKISHHGSRTGTDNQLLTRFPPKYAFISAGTHKRFRHPHSETITALNRHNIDFNLSKDDGSMVYSVTENKIEKAPLIYRKI